MLSLLDGPHVSGFTDCCGCDIVGAVIYTRLMAYGTGDPSVHFWYAERSGQTVGAVSAADGELIGTSSDEAVRAEIRELARFIGCRRVVLHDDLLRDEKTRLMRYGGPAAETGVPRSGPDVFALTSEELAGAYGVIFPDGEADRSLWLTDVSHKLRHGLIRGKYVSAGGRIVSVCLTSGETDGLAVISAVSTAEGYRGRGFASAAVTALAEELVREGKKTELVCPVRLEGFYGRLSFSVI